MNLLEILRPKVEGTLDNLDLFRVPKVQGENRISQAKGRSKYYINLSILYFSGVAYDKQLFLFLDNHFKEILMEKLLEIVQNVNTYLTDYVLIILLVGIGLFFTIATRFVQIRFFGKGIKIIGLQRASNSNMVLLPALEITKSLAEK